MTNLNAPVDTSNTLRSRDCEIDNAMRLWVGISHVAARLQKKLRPDQAASFGRQWAKLSTEYRNAKALSNAEGMHTFVQRATALCAQYQGGR